MNTFFQLQLNLYLIILCFKFQRNAAAAHVPSYALGGLFIMQSSTDKSTVFVLVLTASLFNVDCLDNY